MENASKANTDFSDDMDMPEGYAEVQQTRLWFSKAEGAILQGIILNRVQRKDATKQDGVSWFYEVRISRECMTTTADEDDGKKKVDFIAQPGQIVCIDEFAGNGNWKYQLPTSKNATDVWMKFIRKDKLDGLKTMWKVKQGFKKVANKNETVEDNIPF